MYYVIKKSLKIASRNVLEIRFVASMAARVEVERSGTVHYLEQDLGTVLILSCVRNKSARRRSWKERKKKKRSGKRYTRCRVGWAKMQGKVSWAKVVTYRLCQTPPISLNDLASKNPTFLGTLLFLLFSFVPSNVLSSSFPFAKFDYLIIPIFLLDMISMKLSTVIL